jgi:hypothetical protein
VLMKANKFIRGRVCISRKKILTKEPYFLYLYAVKQKATCFFHFFCYRLTLTKLHVPFGTPYCMKTLVGHDVSTHCCYDVNVDNVGYR